MPRIAFVFPGQGAQSPGMGKELAAAFPAAADIYAQANEILGFDITELCFNGSATELDRTELAQPALLTTSMAIYEVMRCHGLEATMMAGLSLGEYSALVAAGALSLAEALPLVHRRGQYMQNAVPAGEGAMMAILGTDISIIESACSCHEGIVSVANYNAPGQTVISGQCAAVTEVASTLKANGARVVPIAISVPSHCALMISAAEALKKDLDSITWNNPTVPVVSNYNAQPNKAFNFTDILMHQLYCPVQWESSVRYLLQNCDGILRGERWSYHWR